MFKVYYFTSASNRNPVNQFIYKQPRQAREKILSVIEFFKTHGFHLETDYLRRLSGTKNLWELRAKYQSTQYRIFIAPIGRQAAVLLHAITKKTAKTPRKDMQIASKRLHQLQIALK